MAREVTVGETKWSCVQAYAGVNEDGAAAQAAQEGGKVTVVCTPAGGEQSVRLELATEWELLSDEELARAIAAHRS